MSKYKGRLKWMAQLGRINTEELNRALADDEYARELITRPTIELHKTAYDHIQEIYKEQYSKQNVLLGNK